MRLVYYALTLLFGLLGVLGMLRSLERLATGEGVMPVQVIFGVGGLLLARTYLLKARKARASPAPHGPA
ncbi:MAG TPA: hypothetical protein VFP50_01985 [Anaeromyxobacteraceae bacterium]|nr:hypothetical protein [Anaeromyxobacteraceae bacterium]